MPLIGSGSVIINSSNLKGIYKQIDKETVVCINGESVTVWNIEDDKAIQLTCIHPGKSGKTAQQIADEIK